MPVDAYPMIPRFEPGQLIDADRFNQIIDMINSMRLSATAPLASRVTPSGTELYYQPLPVFGIGITTTTVPARTSGTTTPNSGTVQPYIDTGTTLVLNGGTITVKNWTGGSIASGVLVAYHRFCGQWYVIAADCSGTPT